MKRLFVILSILFSTALISSCGPKKTAEVKSEPMSDSAAIQYQFSYEFYSKGDLIRAYRSILQAEQASPKSTDVLNLKGLILFRQEKYEESERAFQEALNLDPGLSEVLNNLGTLYFQEKKYDKAEAVLKRALDNPLYLYPERIHNNLGLVYYAQSKPKQAKDEFLRSIQVRDDFYLAYQNLGKLLLKENNYEDAKPYLEAAVKNCPKCSEPHYHLGTVLLKENNRAEAIKLFREAYKLDPNGYYGQLGKRFLVDEGETPETEKKEQ